MLMVENQYKMQFNKEITLWSVSTKLYELPRDKTNKMTAPSKDSDQPGNLISLRCLLNG